MILLDGMTSTEQVMTVTGMLAAVIAQIMVIYSKILGPLQIQHVALVKMKDAQILQIGMTSTEQVMTVPGMLEAIFAQPMVIPMQTLGIQRTKLAVLAEEENELLNFNLL